MSDRGQNKTIPMVMNFIFGGAAGMLSVCCLQPNDLTKTRMQLIKKSKTSLSVIVSDILRYEGFRGFYNGLSAALFRQATYTTFRMGMFNTLMTMYTGFYNSTPNTGEKIVMGCISGGVGGFVGTPAEVCLIRMTADGRLPPEQRRNYTSVFNALRRIAKTEGNYGLWRGALATTNRAMVVNGFQLGSYAETREILHLLLDDGVLLHFCSAMISGLITTAASLPIDIVKTRLQDSSREYEVQQTITLRNIVRTEGPFALWKGFIPSYLKLGPHTVLTFIILEQMNLFYLKYYA